MKPQILVLINPGQKQQQQKKSFQKLQNVYEF